MYTIQNTPKFIPGHTPKDMANKQTDKHILSQHGWQTNRQIHTDNFVAIL